MDNNLGLALIGISIFCGLTMLGHSLQIGMTRSTAIASGMTADQYVDWVMIADK